MTDKLIEPRIGDRVYIAPTAFVGGDVVIGDQVTVMHQVVIRGDIAPIRIGARGNLQDGAVLHTANGVALEVGDEVSVGHGAILHGRRVGSQTLIGIGSILLDGCEVGSRCIIGAATLVPPNMIVPDGSVVMGVPGTVVRQVDDRDLARIDEAVESYLNLGRLHTAGRFPNIAGQQTNPHNVANTRENGKVHNEGSRRDG